MKTFISIILFFLFISWTAFLFFMWDHIGNYKTGLIIISLIGHYTIAFGIIKYIFGGKYLNQKK